MPGAAGRSNPQQNPEPEGDKQRCEQHLEYVSLHSRPMTVKTYRVQGGDIGADLKLGITNELNRKGIHDTGL